MRIRQFDLERFGRFTDQRILFGEKGDGPDFHIIHGRNEAGKTTMMEGFLRLLYGFPHRDPYDFKHGRPNLRVSALLEIDGRAQRFTRLPLRSGALLDHAGTPLPETALAAHLGGLSMEDYRQLLCLDDDTIERGGEEIASARGDIGRLLFSAAAGVADLTAVLDGVRAEADALFRPRASKTELAALKRELADVTRQIRDRDVSAAVWGRMKQAVQQASGQETAARDALATLRAQAAQVEARRRALPLLAEHDRIAAAIAPHAALPERLDFTPEDLVALLTDQTRATADRDRLTGEIAELEAARAEIDPSPEALPLAGALDALDALRSRDATAALDLPRRRVTLRDLQQDMARALCDLGVPGPADPLAFVLSPADLAHVESARDALHAAQTAHDAETAEVADLRDRHDTAKHDLDHLSAQAPAPRGIAGLLARFDADGLAVAHAAARAALDQARTQLHGALDALPGGGPADGLPAPCPLSEPDLADLARRHDAVCRAFAQTCETLASLNDDAAVLRNRILHSRDRGGFLDDATAAALRTERDRLWTAHRAAPDTGSADAFETAMRQVDASLDARLLHARDLGELRQTEQALADLDTRIAALEARRDGQAQERAMLQTRLDQAGTACGLEAPVRPDALVAHAARLCDVHTAARHLARQEDRHSPVILRAARLLEALSPLVGLEDPDIDTALTAARALAETERSHATALAGAERALAALKTDLARRTAKHAELGRLRAQAEAAWDALIRQLFAGHVQAETVLASLAPLRTLRELQAQHGGLRRSIDAMAQDQRDFARDMAALAARHALPADAPAGETHARLRDLATQAQQTRTRHAALTAQIDAADSSRAAAQVRLAAIADRVNDLARLFPQPPEGLDALRAATALTATVNDKRLACRDLQRRILSELGAPDLTTARSDLAATTLAALEAEAGTLVGDCARADTALTAATEARSTAQAALNAIGGDSDIALLTERKATLELQIEDTALRYLELHLGHRLADEAIRRYRDTHRSAMMQATERSFAALTDGAYTALRSAPENGAETLRAIAADGAAKRAEEMSKGTRFQLYLALRAAAHEQLGARGLHLPFFCDDIFETFDEDRTRAACRVMEQIATTGQAVYLTHHRHVVDIASEVCGVAPTVHRLD